MDRDRRAVLACAAFSLSACAPAAASSGADAERTGSARALAAVAQVRAARAAPEPTEPAEGALRALGGWIARSPGAGGSSGADVRLSTEGAAFRIEERASGLRMEARMRGATARSAEILGAHVVYPAGGPEGSDVVHRPRADGTEDYVVFERAPAASELVYDVELGASVAGLRLVGGVLELLDSAGIPRLRVLAPHVKDALGVRHPAELGLHGCAFDASPRAPWGRAVTPPAARRCEVRVGWDGAAVVYPAVVDPAWMATGSLAVPRENHAAVVLSSGEVLVAGGADFLGAFSSVEIYDPDSGAWAITGKMSVPRTWLAAVSLGAGQALVAGGYGLDGSAVGSAELYDAETGAWSPAGELEAPRWSHASARLGSGEVLVVGGQDGEGVLASAEIFDPSSRSWSSAGALATGRRRATASALPSGGVLVAGGDDGESATASAEIYDPASGAFAETGSMAFARVAHTASVLPSGEVLVAGGYAGQMLRASAELYDEAAGAFSPAGSMASARALHTASVLPSGEVLVAGGWDGGAGALASTERFVRALAAWSPAGDLARARLHHTASVVQGDVVVAAGFGGEYLASAERHGLRPGGAACSASADCRAGFCADGVCCDRPCDGACEACSAKRGAPVDGTCGLAPSGSPGAPACAPWLCDGVLPSCPSACSGDAACVAPARCRQGTCALEDALLAEGEACSEDAQCASGTCVSGACCAELCAPRAAGSEAPRGGCACSARRDASGPGGLLPSLALCWLLARLGVRRIRGDRRAASGAPGARGAKASAGGGTLRR